MRSCQWEAGLRVKAWIRSDLPLHVLNIPAFCRVTLGTGYSLKAIMEFFGVRRLVTGFTGLGRNRFKEIGPQRVRHSLGRLATESLMTIEALILDMFTRDRETGLSIVIELQIRFPGDFGVTGCTVLEWCRKLVRHFLTEAVKVSVTARAGLLHTCELKVCESLALVTRLVTVRTLNLSMFALKDKSCDVVFKVWDFPLGLILIVALKTIATAKFRREIFSMLIFVARQTFLSLKLWPFILNVIFALRNVTFHAFELSVITDQGITRFGLVIKFLDLFPALCHVAAAALFAFEFVCLKKVNVVFFVTGDTRIHFAEETSIVLAGLFFCTLFGVTFFAFGLGVTTIKNKTGLFMIEFVLIEAREVVVTTFMFLVTFETKLRLHHEAVKVSFFFHMFIDGFMTGEAVLVGNSPTRFVAL